uniref:RING-type domain-containing protein n=1 Tax=Aegilops tauschii subsp. strangulata TaxID=200361 RepID=A0A453GS18_AEGTS
ASASVAPPVGARCAVCRGVDISVPHQANCSHWFCGHCIVGVWLQGSVLRPSNCPVCRRPITLLVPSEVASLLRDEPEIAPVMNRIEQYNGRFAGVPHSMIQWLLDQPFYMRRMLAEFRDTRQEPPSSFKIQVALAVSPSMCPSVQFCHLHLSCDIVGPDIVWIMAIREQTA